MKRKRNENIYFHWNKMKRKRNENRYSNLKTLLKEKIATVCCYCCCCCFKCSLICIIGLYVIVNTDEEER